jgi:hypothetical protein
VKNIYIFGNEKFNKNIKNLLVKNEIEDFEIIDSNERLKETIKNSPKECYLIDNEKIYKSNLFHKYIKYLIPKNSIEKTFLKEYSILQLEFDSSQQAIDYIKIRYNDEQSHEIDSQSVEDDYESNNKTLEIILDDKQNEINLDLESKKDLNKITQIEEIETDEMNSVISDIRNKG